MAPFTSTKLESPSIVILKLIMPDAVNTQVIYKNLIFLPLESMLYSLPTEKKTVFKLDALMPLKKPWWRDMNFRYRWRYVNVYLNKANNF